MQSHHDITTAINILSDSSWVKEYSMHEHESGLLLIEIKCNWFYYWWKAEDLYCDIRQSTGNRFKFALKRASR